MELSLDQNALSKLTDWAKEPTLTDLKDDLLIAKPGHDTHVTDVNRWLDLRNITGASKPKGTNANRSKVQPKLVRKQNEWRYASMSEPFLSSPKTFTVSPTTFEDVETAKQNQALLNYQFRSKLNRVAFVDEYVRTGVDEGTVVVKVGWCRETKMVKEPTQLYAFSAIESDEEFQQLQAAIELKHTNPRGFTEMPEALQEAANYATETQQAVKATPSGTAMVEVEKIIYNHPTLDIVAFENLYLDPSCNGDPKKAGFAVISFETSQADLLKDGRYKNLKYVNWSTNTPLTAVDHSSYNPDASQQFKDNLRKRVVAHEYWGWSDINDDKHLVPIVATWIGDVMIRMEENPFPDKAIPIVIVSYMPIKRSVTGEPDAELLEENQSILGAVTRGMIDLMGRSANSQTGIAKGMLDVVNRRRYNNGQDYEFNPQAHPGNSIHTHVYPEIPQSAMVMVQNQNQEAEALTGVKAFSGGLSGEAYGDVAAGIHGMLDASAKREMSILRRFAAGFEEIGLKIAKMNAVFLSEEETIRITNTEFISIRREDLAGDFDIIVDIATPEIDEAKSKDLAFMVQTIGNTLDPSMSQILLSEIATLKRMPDLAERIAKFKPEPDPMQEKVKELEIQRIELENAEIQSRVALNQAKARAVVSGADKTDLDYVEQESGTKHARDIDRQGAQAEANKDLEITKTLLNTDPEVQPTKIDAVQTALDYEILKGELTNTLQQ